MKKTALIILAFFVSAYAMAHTETLANTSRNYEVPQQKPYILTANDVTISGNAIVGYKNKTEKNIIIPAKIGKRAFAGRKLIAIKLPNTLKIIEEKAFARNKITNIIIPPSVNKIGDFAFENDSLQKLTIPKSVRQIGYGAFSNNYIKELNLPATVKLGRSVFSSNKIEKFNGKNSEGFIFAQS